MKKIFIVFLMTLGFSVFAEEDEVTTTDFPHPVVVEVEKPDWVKEEPEWVTKVDKILNLMADKIINILGNAE